MKQTQEPVEVGYGGVLFRGGEWMADGKVKPNKNIPGNSESGIF